MRRIEGTVNQGKTLWRQRASWLRTNPNITEIILEWGDIRVYTGPQDSNNRHRDVIRRVLYDFRMWWRLRRRHELNPDAGFDYRAAGQSVRYGRANGDVFGDGNRNATAYLSVAEKWNQYQRRN